MLRGLDIRDMLLIDRLELTFQPGLNVLTGETGAGKSILLDSLGFVLGWRGRADLVRAGASQGEVTATFDLPPGHSAHRVLAEAGLPGGDELILRRINAGDGRKSGFVNDRRTSGEVLRALSDTLVELHGQHDDRGLLNPRGHLRLLDQYADAETALDVVRKAWRAHRAAAKALEAAQAGLDAVRAEEEFLRHAVVEFDALDPQPGEEAALDRARRHMQGAERIRESVASALTALGNDGATGRMSDALRWLEDVEGQADGLLEAPLAALGRALDELAEAETGVAQCLDALDVDPHALENAEERLFAIRALARKHDVLPDALSSFAEDMRAKLAALDAGAGDLSRLEREVTEAGAAYDRAAERLRALRGKAAHRLDRAMAGELAPLRMERAIFVTEVSAAASGPDGIDAVQFTVATNPGAPAGPIGRIASGGELSRFLLALKVCLTRGDTGLTLIFDEIDRGVGGATADAVGRRLSALAEGQQVLVVTHSPQVAAQGAHHWRVEKSVSGDVTTTNVVHLNAAQRIDEIARMLSGDTVTDEARSAAAKLLTG